MPRKKQKQQLPLLAVIIAILFATGMIFSQAFVTQTKLGVPTVLGEEDEGGAKESEEADEVDGEDEEDGEEVDEEDEQDEAEEDEVSNKQRTGNKNNSITRTAAGGEIEDDEDEDGEDLETGEENEVTGKIGELERDLKKAEARIAVLAASGVTVNTFNTGVAEIKSLLSQAATATNPESLLEVAESKMERLEKMTKLALGDEDSDEEEGDEQKDATEELAELEMEITKAEFKLEKAATAGVDVAAARSALMEAKSLLASAKENLAAGDFAGAEAAGEMADKKLEQAKHLLENESDDLEEGEDEDLAREYKNSVAQFVHNLERVGDLEEGIGQQVKTVAQAQAQNETKVGTAIAEVESRGGFAKFLIGPKYASLGEIKAEIAANQKRIVTLAGILPQITDSTVKQSLQEQIRLFEVQNEQLQKFVTDNEAGISLFGWLARLFS